MRLRTLSLGLLLGVAGLLTPTSAVALTWLDGDTTPPVITVPGPITAEATSPGGAVVTYTEPTATDTDPPNPSVTCSAHSGDTFPLGPTTVTCTASDTAGNSASAEFTITVQDTTPPSFGPVPDVSMTTTTNAPLVVTYEKPAATDLGQSLDVTCTPASGSSFAIGTTPVSCTANDGRGNSAEVHFNVVVTLIDNQPPTFTKVPGSSTNEATGPGGATVTWSIEATDNTDPSPTISCNPQSGSTFPLGATPVACTATDDFGNVTPTPATFTVTVVDTTKPTLNLPSNQQVDTQSPGGTSVTYSASASDLVAGTITPSCSPPSGATFAIGTTTVNCSANDGHGNTASGSFTVTVVLVDHTAPVLTGVPPNKTLEANGPGGSVTNFPTPTATDNLDGPIALVTCNPPSGSMFPLGTTNVTCGATDAHGNTGTASFSIHVVDTTKPTLVIPSDRSAYAETPTGLGIQSHAVVLFLSGASAVDTVDPHPTIWNNAPEFFEVGTHVVTFVARDASGNEASGTAVLDVRPMPPPGTPPLSTPPARTAPPEVQGLKVQAGDARVRLSWQTPAGVDHVVISRRLSAGGDEQTVYTGSSSAFTDRGVVNGLEYRYLVVSVNARGDRSAGVAATALPKQTLLRSPKDGARLRKAPKLVWLRNTEATYYNVQLFRGNLKILSTWPVRASYLLKPSWKYEQRTYKLTPGVYRWYVWPGFGARSAVDYGEMLGFSTFQIVR